MRTFLLLVLLHDIGLFLYCAHMCLKDRKFGAMRMCLVSALVHGAAMAIYV